MTKEGFERRATDLLPGVSNQAMKSWLGYAKSLGRDDTETGSEIFDRSYMELALIERHRGVETAATLFNYGEKFVFNYFELCGAAEFLREGWPLGRISDHAVGNGCDPTLEAMEEFHAALEELRGGRWDTRRNKRKFSPDLPRGIRQFHALEQGLGDQDGTLDEWIRATYEVSEDFDQSFAEVVSGLCGTFHDTGTQYGRDISRQLYNTLAAVLPAETRSATRCPSLDGSPDHVPAPTLVEFLMEPQDHDSMLRTAKHMNNDGDAESACYAAQGRALRGRSPQHQQTM